MEPVIKLYGLRAAKFAITVPADRADDLKPILRVIGKRMLTSEKHLFQTEGSSGGVHWKALEDSTVARKDGNAKILDRSGEEKESLSKEGAPYNLFNVTKSFVLIGSNHPAVPIQKSGSKHMDERDPIVFRADQVSRWGKMLDKFIFDGVLPNV